MKDTLKAYRDEMMKQEKLSALQAMLSGSQKALQGAVAGEVVQELHKLIKWLKSSYSTN